MKNLLIWKKLTTETHNITLPAVIVPSIYWKHISFVVVELRVVFKVGRSQYWDRLCVSLILYWHQHLNYINKCSTTLYLLQPLILLSIKSIKSLKDIKPKMFSFYNLFVDLCAEKMEYISKNVIKIHRAQSMRAKAAPDIAVLYVKNNEI